MLLGKTALPAAQGPGRGLPSMLQPKLYSSRGKAIRQPHLRGTNSLVKRPHASAASQEAEFNDAPKVGHQML